jgi:hypothetical protein
VWFFTRGGYSGLPGSTAYEGANFPGDESTDWDHAAGLASFSADMLGRAVDRAYGFGTDIGGYADYTTPATTKKPFLRWAEWAALTLVFRLQGAGLHGTHTPWSFDARTVSTYRRLSQLHQAAAPLILRLWRVATRTGMPVTRPLWLQYPSSARPGARTRKGCSERTSWWRPLSVAAPARAASCSHRVLARARSRRDLPRPTPDPRSAPLTRLPYFFRCGTRSFSAR